MPRRKKNSSKQKNVEQSTSGTNVEEKDEGEIILSGISKDTCILKNSPQIGRYLVAKRRIRQGEVILKEEALVVGPCQDSEPVCIGCCTLLKTDIQSSLRCESCGWPICSRKCPGVTRDHGIRQGGHTEQECHLLKTYPGPLTTSSYNLIVPLRCLLLQTSDPAAWTHVMNMESHDDLRRDIPDIWNRNELTVVKPIRQLEPDYPEELIHSICGKLEVNCFSVGEDGVDARALYPIAYLLQHDCTPNTTHLDSGTFHITIRASTDIQTTTPITLSYTSSLYGTWRRRQELKRSKFFDCCCARCSSDTELGTYMNAVKCQLCVKGWLLPSMPLLPESNWVCCSCREPVHYTQPVNITQRSSFELDVLKDASISQYENLMTKYVGSLHPNHSTMVRIKFTLSQMYGKTEGYLLGQMPIELVQRKFDLCNGLMTVFDVVEPGMSRLRGVTMYECHAPLLILTQISATVGSLTQDEVRKNLTKVKDMLTKSVAILSFEFPGTSEGRLYQVAKQALAQTEDWPI